MLKCNFAAIDDTCGKRAAEWQYRAHRTMIQPTMDWANCDLGGTALLILSDPFKMLLWE